MLIMQERHSKILHDILARYPYQFYAFGSRVTGKAKQFSDLDIVYKDIIPSGQLIQLIEDLEESDLPFKVDLVNWHECTADFQQRIEKDLIKIS